MQLRKVKMIFRLCFALFCFSAEAQVQESFRTPAKIYAGAYAVKVKLKSGLTEYDVPMWIKPDQAESALDPVLMKELGYVDTQFEFNTVKIAEDIIEQKKFKSMKTEWAYVPDFAKSCCFGVLGRDVLQDYEIRFDPNPPAHVEWIRLIGDEEARKKTKPGFISDLKKLFSLTGDANRAVTLNIQEQKLVYEGEAPKARAPALFSFGFVPPSRKLQVYAILPKDGASAKKVGFKSGMMIEKINGEAVSALDRWYIEKMIRGEISQKISFETDQKKKLNYDFTSKSYSN